MDWGICAVVYRNSSRTGRSTLGTTASQVNHPRRYLTQMEHGTLVFELETATVHPGRLREIPHKEGTDGFFGTSRPKTPLPPTYFLLPAHRSLGPKGPDNAVYKLYSIDISRPRASGAYGPAARQKSLSCLPLLSACAPSLLRPGEAHDYGARNRRRRLARDRASQRRGRESCKPDWWLHALAVGRILPVGPGPRVEIPAPILLWLFEDGQEVRARLDRIHSRGQPSDNLRPRGGKHLCVWGPGCDRSSREIGTQLAVSVTEVLTTGWRLS